MDISYKKKPDEVDLLKQTLHPLVQKWFFNKFESFTLPQQYGIYNIHTRINTLISAPTGSSKTLTAFLAILNQLVDDAMTGRLEDKTYAIYVSPLKALNYDISHNLSEPLAEIEQLAKKPLGIRVGVRTGDTTPYQRQKMVKIPPHILITTPESLGLLLVQEKHLANFSQLQWFIVDEIHALANNKRGTQLSLLLEQLAYHTTEFCRIGLSATAEPLDKIAKFLVGTKRDCQIVKISYEKERDLAIEIPREKIIETDYHQTQEKLYKVMHEHIQNHKSTLIFTNTRAGTERIVHALKTRYPEKYYEINEEPPFERSELIAAHHSSLSKEYRGSVEQSLRNGKLKCVVCSSSLELGLDIGFIDLVILLQSPKRVSTLLQRIGRSGHKYKGISKGRLITQQYEELIECSALVANAQNGIIDAIHIPTKPLDVLCQWIIAMCITQSWSVKELCKHAQKSYIYRDLTTSEFRKCVEYLSENYPDLETQYVFSKLNHDKETDTIAMASKTVKLMYMQNSGTITDSGAITVKQQNTIIGNVDESFAENLKPKDVFVLGGESYQFLYMRGMTIQVVPSHGRRPTVPRWYSQALALSFDDAQGVAKLKESARVILSSDKTTASKKKELGKLMHVAGRELEEAYFYLKLQEDYIGIPKYSELLVEHFEDGATKYTIIHSHLGRKANESFAILLTHTLKRAFKTEVQFVINDTGFYLSGTKFVNVQSVVSTLTGENLEDVYMAAIEQSHHLKARFRGCAVRSLLIIPHYKGKTKHVRRQNLKSMMLYNAIKRIDNNHPLIVESKREVLEDDMDYKNTQSYISKIASKKITLKTVQTTVCSPFAFNLIVSAYADVMKAEHRYEFIHNMQQMVIAKIALSHKKENKKLEYDIPKNLDTNFSYNKIWKEEERIKKVQSSDLDDELRRVIRRLDIDGSISFELHKLLQGDTQGYSENFIAWFSELIDGAIPKLWSDELISTLVSSFEKIEQ